MSFLKKLFSSQKQKEEESVKDASLKNLPLDEIFVKEFIEKNGKFLYCTTLQEVTQNLNQITKENSWDTIICNDIDLLKLVNSLEVKIEEKFSNNYPIFISCEHLIAENGSVLFSSNQLKDTKIPDLSDNFIVYATTSQLVKTKGESLTGIKARYRGNIPSNISPIKNYNIGDNSKDFMSYGNTNSKNLYLLLFEDL